MFEHLFFGAFVYSIASLFYFDSVNYKMWLVGAGLGIAADFISLVESGGMTTGKWAHKHRNGFSHSIFFPCATYLFLIFLGWHEAYIVPITLAMLTHPVLDMKGIGWGVMLFYPFDKKIYKFFYRGQLLKVFKPDELEREVRIFGAENWFRLIYLEFKPIAGVPWWYGFYEWICLILFIFIGFCLYIIS
jgi:hypothetical protein